MARGFESNIMKKGRFSKPIAFARRCNNDTEKRYATGEMKKPEDFGY